MTKELSKLLKLGTYEQVIDYVCLLRYRTKYPKSDSPSFLTYNILADVTGLRCGITKQMVYKRQRKFAARGNLSRRRGDISADEQHIDLRKKRKLTEEHVEYINRREVVRGWTGLSLDERVVKLQQRFPGVQITGRTLANYYRRLFIRRKPVQIKKIMGR